MPKAKTKTKQKKRRRRHKYCPVCKEIVPMPVMREAEGEDDLYWLTCSQCESTFALTRQQYHRKRRPKMSAIKKLRARIYRIGQTYSVGETIFHRKLNDVGVIVDKASAPIVDCSGAIVVSFLRGGQKILIEGYTSA